MASKKLLLNLFDMNCVGHNSHGLWKHPDNERRRYNDLSYWTDLAQLLEKGMFDALFLADVIGVYDVYKQTRDISVKHAVQVPANDPALIVPAMAHVTRHLGFAVTVSTSYEHPFTLARRMSTLDHLTRGRIAWNIVTSYLPNAARNFGRDEMIKHDDRYALAEEFLEVCYKLWEGSWEEGSVVFDPANDTYADPAKVHEIGHKGEHFQVAGPHLCEPSPQRTPVIYQAGSSERGRAFAARHAECVFVGGQTPEALRFYVDDIRRQAKAAGRNPEQILMFKGFSAITAPTAAEARDKFEEFKQYRNGEAALAQFCGSSGYDLSQLDPDQLFQYTATEGNQTRAAQYTQFTKPRTVREVMESIGKLGGGWMKVGTPIEIADEIQRWVDETGIDGLNFAQVVTPGTVKDFIELVVPELQNRGLVKEQYEEGTYRQKLFGNDGPLLPETHPGAGYRQLDASFINT
ncbi:LLM class flavin-dependent oxidoreductase [Paenibacillus sp. TAB 01]|uniref:LLM class flavin-dependent oxidoreductase n=1 Tax=Paenibacillus sp. TAB 01 TaxID=3368988 RepID=UPI0037509186